MKMLANKNNMTSAAILAAVLALMACVRSDTQAAQPAPSVQVAGLDEQGDAMLPTIVERRHFAIYSAYRVLFDDSPAVFQAGGGGQDEGLQHAVMTADGGTPACFMHAVTMQD